MKTFDEALDFIFKKLDKEAVAKFEKEIEENEDLAELVDGLLDFCIDYNLITKEEFHKKWGEMKPGKENFFSKIDKTISKHKGKKDDKK